MAFVPEGRCDRSLARSAWESATPKEPSRRVRSDSCRCADRFDDWSDAIPKAKTEKICCMISCLLGLAAPDHIVGRCPRQRGPFRRDRRSHCRSHRYLSLKLSPGISKRQRVECCCRFRNAGTPVEKFESDGKTAA